MPTIKANEITISYEIAGAGPPLLLITGLGYGGWFWHKVTPGRSSYFQITTFDNRGAGQTDHPPGPYTIPQMAADTAGLIEALGLTDVYLVGHSMGGLIAQELVLSRPELVRKLVLASTNFGGPNVIPITPEALDVLMNRDGDPVELVKRGVTVATAPGFLERNPDVLQELIAYRLSDPVPPAQYQAQIAGAILHNAENRLSQIQCPTLILFGAHDKVVPPGNGDLMAAKIAGAQLKLLPHVGHIFPLEDPAATTAALLEFFDT
jgi:pimeloyl-ACP methyl ester carboxylesterase